MNLYELDEFDNDQQTKCATCGETFADWELEAGQIDCFICETLSECED